MKATFAVASALLLSVAAGWWQSAGADVPHSPVKAAYVSYYGIGTPAVRDRIVSLLDHTELNSVVIDVKGDDGFIPYETRVPLAIDAGARGPVRVKDFDSFTLVDYLCPMTYPSSYHRGIPGYRNPVAHPYEVVFETVRRMRTRTSQTRVHVRPWIQDFRDYAFDRRVFGVSQLRSEIGAAEEAGATGWMLWNPRNRYTGGGAFAECV